MLESQSRTSETSRIVATIASSDMEVGLIGMDFIIGLPRTQKGNNSIRVIVDRLTKVAHFIPVKTTYHGDKYADLYIQHILKLHGVPNRIVSDRGPQFTSYFWKCSHAAPGTTLDYSTAYHLQTDGQTERVNQIL